MPEPQPRHHPRDGALYALDGSPAANAEVFWSFRQLFLRSFQVDAQGQFEIPDLPMGTHPLVVINGREIVNANVSLDYDGQVKEVELRPFGIGTVTGTVYDEGSGMVPTGADVRFFGMKPDVFGWLRYGKTPLATLRATR